MKCDTELMLGPRGCSLGTAESDRASQPVEELRAQSCRFGVTEIVRTWDLNPSSSTYFTSNVALVR